MQNVSVDCLKVGSPDRYGMTGMIFRVEGFPFDILVRGLAGNFNDNIFWLFFQN